MTQEEWRAVVGFPDYEISMSGLVCRSKSGRPVRPSSNGQGHWKVMLYLNGRAYTRSLDQLVAKTFLVPPQRSDFASIIHLDGDTQNDHALNLMWRPRHFAVLYHRQFALPTFRRKTSSLIEVKTGDIYDQAQHAVVRNGLLLKELLLAVGQNTYVWPTYQEFRELEK